MKKNYTQQLGVTLLEIMLVLAIAAMVIIMSIRYYQSSSSSEFANATMETIQGITSAMDNISNGGAGSYSNITTSTLTAVVGTSNMTTPTGGTVTMTGASSTTYQVTIPLNTTVCTNVLAKITGTKYVAPSCDASGTLTYTYNSSL